MYALIVDDEQMARETISQIIQLYCPQIKTIAEAHSVDTAIAQIKKRKPDLLFLDIRLEGGNGFDVLKRAAMDDLNVIFITAYDEYAIKAFKVSAIDYLLKPIDPDDFITAVEKAHQKVTKESMNSRIDLFLQNMAQQNVDIKKITLNTAENFHVVNIEDIIYCEAYKNYTTFHLKEGKQITISKNLREYEELLPRSNFMRAHQSYLVNFNHVIRYEKGDKNHLITTEHHQIPVATRKKEQVIQFLKQLR
ncbi:LytR/AlgR family response regulator transcription factor [Aureispira anguillae]|uniref:LytTR family DNA-binding domain-containing protein n=1 Tax=Aureispira anguillae TaxID=2864201 RepID=A0A916DW22_9BACT|nr:LytTR family DNA-binding domain-containing protein [Aureispira anguillae]BDS15006.1 LytTR family DNA-binding domain-containing protein [Aureispira anguillae]